MIISVNAVSLILKGVRRPHTEWMGKVTMETFVSIADSLQPPELLHHILSAIWTALDEATNLASTIGSYSF